ncbi:glycoside hydrolase [Mycena maculata]|uniref:mannan endo-1,4-beta-mannosidase n=1 Tax=Mycena maculata TaxID=230809 RepID=A0AAD7K1Y3_9AGAR|nr:glycoside hydrolase [Mycena maculata]
MIKLNAVLVALALTLPSVLAQSPIYGQCGGIGWTGPTTCATGSVCTFGNPYYSQCLPGVGTTTSPPTSTVSSTSSTASTSTVSTPPPVVTGFVTTNGQKFELNGEEYTLVGSNNYWVGLMNFSPAEMSSAFADMAGAGATTSRTWGFDEVTTDPGIAYYQIWDGATPTINTGANGLENFDNVVAAAKANGIRLIVTLTNNWNNYGGSDVYVDQILGANQFHDYFYSNAQVIAAYKNYVETFVKRYLDEPTILAWELINEPRCAGSTSTASPNCTTETITNWASELSAFIKSIDSNHLVSVGDEGFFNFPNNPNFLYTGDMGVDNVALTTIDTIDFGTFHMYPFDWAQTTDPLGFGDDWIANHTVLVQQALNKPVILEEFGVIESQLDQVTAYTEWYNDVIKDGLTGDLIWQAGSTDVENANDGYMVFPGTSVYTLLTEHAAALKARNA